MIEQTRAFARRHVLDEKFICRDQLRLWALSLVRASPPGAPGESFTNQRKSGAKKVARDIARVFLSLSDGQIASTFSNASLPSGHSAVKFTSGAVVLVPDGQFDMAVSDDRMRTHFLKYWDPSTGKVRGHKVKHKEGKWTVLDGFVTSEKSVARFTKNQQRKVGRLKAGWVPAVEYFAGLTGGKTGTIPKWVSAQSRKSGRGFEAWTGGDGFVLGSNMVPWAERRITSSFLNVTARIREKDLQTQAAKRYSKLIERANAER